MRISVLAVLLLVGHWAQATDYYVSPNGNDSNNGTSPSTPWKTISRVNQAPFSYQPGDRILFERGGTWRGEVLFGSSGTASQPITMGAYGTGAMPIIKGSVAVSGWTVYQGNIWRASVTSGKVEQVYVNGKRMTPARYPNTGFLYNTQGGGNQLQSNGLTQPNGYWNGATAVVRGSNWSWDTLFVTGYNNSTLQFSSGVTYLANNAWGFFLRGKLSELDSPGEWYYDRVAKQLYLWAPGGANPNSVQVEASVYANGVNCYWERTYQRVQDIEFMHQCNAGVLNDGANRLTVNNCSFRNLYKGIRSAGHNNTYSNNTLADTYATGITCLGNGDQVSGNSLKRIAMVDGEGESAWGYFGIRAIGTGVVIRENRLDSIGYTGINVNADALVEKNVVRRAVAILNDGGGIAFDHTNGMIIQDNIVSDILGSLDNGVAPTTPYNDHIAIGIFVGNTAVRNTIIQRNTVSNCPRYGINVDHTMVTSGVQVKNNVLFNNKVQLAVSDYSNNVGEGAVPPYYVANYNDVYSGNVLYSVAKDQLCMLHYNVHGPGTVDFGTFANNKYYSPYNELSIQVINFAAAAPRSYTLERWQAEKGEDAGSTRSAQRLPDHAVTQELTGNLVQNGTFTNNVNGWTGWPTNAQVSHVTNYLDNGALKAYLPNNSIYPNFILRNPDPFPVQNNGWYRVRCSIQSNANGQATVGVKGESTSNNPYTIWQQDIPFSTERRDLEMFFRSNLTDQARIQFLNEWTDPMYYLDNVEVTRVNVQPLDPLLRHKLLVNDQPQAQSFTLPAGCWKDMDGNWVTGGVTVPAYGSKVVYLDDGPDCNLVSPIGGVKVKMYLAGAMRLGENLMGNELRTHGLIPASEPYSGQGYSVENAGATASTTVMQGSGAQAVVDWVLVQLHQDNSGYTLAGARAALLLRNGNVVTPEGNNIIVFNASAAGKHVAVRHRNHLGVLCTNVQAGNGELVDFTLAGLPTYGTGARTMVDERMALWAGSARGNGQVKYTGGMNDRDAILEVIGGQEPTSVVFGYRNTDINMDGFTSYTGQNNDREVILQALGGANATVVRTESMP
ncbi:MAG TPA: right-handed parallel beta-helix repeat-containing protein [Flavobacteriales bacterium]|nr:right-handed parallel beta-helix repeat-containing protein [Flavobacteriales bacterium]